MVVLHGKANIENIRRVAQQILKGAATERKVSMKYVDYEEEIDVLESVLSNLESAIGDVQDSPYHSHLAQSWELDKDDIQMRLNELYELQNDQWKAEMREMNMDYEGARL